MHVYERFSQILFFHDAYHHICRPGCGRLIHLFKGVGRDIIVGVIEYYIFSGCKVDSLIPRRGNSAVFLSEILKPDVRSAEFPSNLAGTVGGAVIYYDNFKILESLILYRFQHIVYVVFHIVHRYCYRNLVHISPVKHSRALWSCRLPWLYLSQKPCACRPHSAHLLHLRLYSLNAELSLDAR